MSGDQIPRATMSNFVKKNLNEPFTADFTSKIL